MLLSYPWGSSQRRISALTLTLTTAATTNHNLFLHFGTRVSLPSFRPTLHALACISVPIPLNTGFTQSSLIPNSANRHAYANAKRGTGRGSIEGSRHPREA
ncbi:hypothetical protein GGS23DRAFT_581089 [Durotheca rogersii]|uniref:uncharacterized protein n=1 Tax=Durotheca rogersii TaxID=419775 RepID=UPI0022210449|nr:uncharacterized protein GGS23DRAFT_581089 [Durotheca rogersii]KAI5860357.1 hypothetical protein GGS23DRAFT_581089 [Durotheca rogersii]